MKRDTNYYIYDITYMKTQIINLSIQEHPWIFTISNRCYQFDISDSTGRAKFSPLIMRAQAGHIGRKQDELLLAVEWQ